MNLNRGGKNFYFYKKETLRSKRNLIIIKNERYKERGMEDGVKKMEDGVKKNGRRRKENGRRSKKEYSNHAFLQLNPEIVYF